MDREESLREAEYAVLNAPFEDRGWDRAVESIAAATASSGAHLIGIGGPLLLPLNVVVGNFSGYESYFGDPGLHGRSNWRVGSTIAPMTIQHEADYAAYRASHDTSDYDDAVSDLDIPFGCQSALLLDSNAMLGIALLRSRRNGPCNEQTLRSFAWLRAQLARAVRVQLALDGEAAEVMVGDMGALDSATILLDRHGSLCAISEAAEQLLESGGPLRLDGLALRCRNPDEDRHFQQALARLLQSDGFRDTLVHQARVGRNGSSWRLCVVRLPKRDSGLGFDPHLAVTVRPAA